MQHLIFFGLPGAGKTYAGKFIASTFDYEFFDGDQELPDEMIQALNKNEPITDEMRDIFMKRLEEKYSTLIQTHTHVILSQTFLQDRHRQQFHRAFPSAKFILIKAPDTLREDRYTHRKEFSFNVSYLRKMVERFEPISVPYTILSNVQEGSESIRTQFLSMFPNTKK